MSHANGLRYAARERLITVPLQPFTVNGTKRIVAFHIPRHAEFNADQPNRYRIVRIEAYTRVVPADADGTMLMNVFVLDKNEGAAPGTDDQIVTSFDWETIVARTATNVALTAETGERERTISDGDAVEIALVNNSVAIDTNIAAGDAEVTFVLLPLNVGGETFGQGLMQ